MLNIVFASHHKFSRLCHSKKFTSKLGSCPDIPFTALSRDESKLSRLIPWFFAERQSRLKREKGGEGGTNGDKDRDRDRSRDRQKEKEREKEGQQQRDPLSLCL